MRNRLRGEKGYTFIELLSVLVILGVLAVGSLSYLRSSAQVAVTKLVQMAMARIAAEAPNMKYPISVTTTDLANHGLGALIADYTINSYARAGTPLGVNYLMELEAPDGTTVFCITESTVVQGGCS